MNKKRLTLSQRQNLHGWAFLTPAVLLIVFMSFVPMVQSLILSLKTGIGEGMGWSGLYNYVRMFEDGVFIQALKNNFFYLLIQVPIMLVLAMILASALNNKDLKFKGMFRTAIFLPCATTLVSSALIFRSLFAVDGFVNKIGRAHV